MESLHPHTGLGTRILAQRILKFKIFKCSILFITNDTVTSVNDHPSLSFISSNRLYIFDNILTPSLNIDDVIQLYELFLSCSLVNFDALYFQIASPNLPMQQLLTYVYILVRFNSIYCSAGNCRKSFKQPNILFFLSGWRISNPMEVMMRWDVFKPENFLWKKYFSPCLKLAIYYLKWYSDKS